MPGVGRLLAGGVGHTTADRYGHRCQCLGQCGPPGRRSSQPARSPTTSNRAVEEWLRADREAPRKRRHTATRIGTRLEQEMPVPRELSTEEAAATVDDFRRAAAAAIEAGAEIHGANG